VLPDDVRLTRLAPAAKARQSFNQTKDELEPGDDRVRLIIQGESRSDGGPLEFVRRLFAHPSFVDPDISREASDEEGSNVEFDVQVIYIPGDQPQQRPTVEETAPPEVLEVPAAPTAVSGSRTGSGTAPGAGR
jgi:hypothetical protein